MRIPALALAALTLCLAAGSALAQKTQLLVYTALETDQLKAYQEGFNKVAAGHRDQVGARQHRRHHRQAAGREGQSAGRCGDGRGGDRAWRCWTSRAC